MNLVAIIFLHSETVKRDTSVTGVQTFALPILSSGVESPQSRIPRSAPSPVKPFVQNRASGRLAGLLNRSRHIASRSSRSEESRVGEEGRSRVQPYLCLLLHYAEIQT